MDPPVGGWRRTLTQMSFKIHVANLNDTFNRIDSDTGILTGEKADREMFRDKS